MTNNNPSLSGMLAAREARNTSSQCPPLISSERDPRTAIAYAISVVNGESAPDRAEALDGLALRVSVLKHGDSDEALEELAAHCPLLESLFLRYTLLAATTRNAEFAVKYQKLALQCQSAFSRTVALIATLKAQREQKARVLIHDDDADLEKDGA